MHASPCFFSYVDEFPEGIHHANCAGSPAGATEGKNKQQKKNQPWHLNWQNGQTQPWN